MKMKFISIFLLGFILITSCKKNNDNTPDNNLPIACFSLDKSTYALNDIAIISNCSKNTTNYSWIIVNNSSRDIVYTYDGDLSTFTIPSTIPAGNYNITLRAYNSSGAYTETTKIITIVGSTSTTIGTPNPGPYTKLYINKIEITGFPANKPNGSDWDYGQTSSYYDLDPDMFIKTYRQTSIGLVDYFDNYSDHFSNRTGSLVWDYTSNPKQLSIPLNEGVKLNIILGDDDGYSFSYETMSQILDVDLFSSSNYGKPTLTFSQGDFSVTFTLQWSN